MIDFDVLNRPKEYWEGWQAHKNGKSRNDNPYLPQEIFKYAQWEFGRWDCYFNSFTD